MERENRALREQVRMLHDRLRVAQEGVASGPSHDHDHDHDNNHDHGNDHDHDHDNDNGNDHDTDTDTDSDDDSDDDDSGSGSGEPRYVNPFAPRGQGFGGRGHGAGSVDSEDSPARPREHFPNFDDAFATVSEQMCGRLDESIDFIAHTNPADISEVRGIVVPACVCGCVNPANMCLSSLVSCCVVLQRNIKRQGGGHGASEHPRSEAQCQACGWCAPTVPCAADGSPRVTFLSVGGCEQEFFDKHAARVLATPERPKPVAAARGRRFAATAVSSGAAASSPGTVCAALFSLTKRWLCE